MTLDDIDKALKIRDELFQLMNIRDRLDGEEEVNLCLIDHGFNILAVEESRFELRASAIHTVVVHKIDELKAELKKLGVEEELE